MFASDNGSVCRIDLTSLNARRGVRARLMVLGVCAILALVLGQSVAHANPVPYEAPVAMSDGEMRLLQRFECVPQWHDVTYFGAAVDIEGDTAVVGSYDEGTTIFHRERGVWVRKNVLPPRSMNIDLDGNTLAIGARRTELVWIYVRSGPNADWELQQQIRPFNNIDGDDFGLGVALDGDTLVAGASRRNRSIRVGGRSVQPPGSAYVFTRTGGVWTERAELKPSTDSVLEDWFGMSVAVEGDTVMVGTYNRGAHVFTRNGADWSSSSWARLPLSGTGMFSDTGRGIIIDGDSAFVATPLNGAVDVLERGPGGWVHSQRLEPLPGQVWLGFYLALDGDTLLAGASGGPVHTYHRSMGGWLPNDSSNGLWGSWYGGESVDLSHGTLITGHPYDYNPNGTTGYVEFFDAAPYGTKEDTSFSADAMNGLLHNDYDADGGALTPELVDTSNLHGDLELRFDGAFTYTPEPDFAGKAIATYRVSDGTDYSDVATITIDVVAVNDAPVALDDTATAQWRQTLSAPSVLANDTDIDGDALAASIETTLSLGTLTMETDGSYTYVAPAGFIGTETFTYRVTDAGGAHAIGTVSIAVSRPDDTAPVARSDEATCTEDGLVGVDVLENDTKDAAVAASLEATGFSQPAHGSLQASPFGEVTYTPDPDWNGTDTFTYRVFDGGLYSEFATVTVNVASVNDRPVSSDDSVDARRNQPVTISVLANDTDIDTEHVSLVIGDHSAAASGTVTAASATRLTYTPARDFLGTETFTYRVFDGELYSEPATVTVTVDDANHAPVLDPAAPEIDAAAAGTQAAPAAGVTVASVLGDSVSDADGDDVGMAVYAMKLRSGAWQYSLDGGASWTDLTSASTDGALLLRPSDKIRFVSYFNTGSTLLSYRAWDGRAVAAGTHVAIEATGGESAFSTATDTATLDVDLPWTDKVGRLWGRDRYATSVATARYASHDWTDVTDIVLVSGDDANASDPLAAAGLVWAYRGAPMIQTSPKLLPSALEPALHEIADKNSAVRLHVVGGTNALPEARIAEIEAVLASRGVEVSHDRVSGANRYDTAAKIAAKMVELRGEEMSGDVLVAHGADRTRFFDALALSPVAATQGSPILLTAPAALSAETSAAIGALDPDRVIVAGGTAVVSQTAFDQIPAADTVRWAGSSRFDTAIVISDHAIAEGMLSPRTVSVCSARPDASSLPDALASTGVSSGDASPLLLTQTADTPAATSAWLGARKTDIRHVWLVGGPAVITYQQEGCISDLLK